MRRLALGFLLLLFTACLLAGPLAGWLGIESAGGLGDRFLPPSPAHPLGTDELGRDILLRLLEGGRISLAVGLSAALAAAVIGTTIGIVAGYRGGWRDDMLMRFTDFIIALPALPLLIVLSAIDGAKLGLPPEWLQSEHASLWRIAALIALLGWTGVARLARARALSLRQSDFVRAAQALGIGHGRILLRHILPNVMDTVLVATALSVGNVILMESVLSFLGLGIQPPLPSWGNMLSGAENVIWEYPLATVWPGLAIFLTVLACNALGTLPPRKARH